MHCVCKGCGDGDGDDDDDGLCLGDYEAQQNEVNRLFPDVDFTIALLLDELDEVISPLNKIIVKQTFDCYCYRSEPTGHIPVPKWYPVHCREGEKMTNRLVIKELARQGFSLECNHRFLEGFNRSVNGGECQFEPATGS